MTSTAPIVGTDPTISDAIRLGWSMADAFHAPAPWNHQHGPPEYPHLPSLAELSEFDRGKVRLNELKHDVEAIGYQDLDKTPLPSATLSDAKTFQDQLTALIIGLHTDLAARNPKLEVALGLGRMLADTAIWCETKPDLERSFGSARLINAYGWLNDLHALLPEYSADAVSGSLKAWQFWVERHALEPRPKNLTRLVHAQGKLWRQLLCGDKSAEDLLRPSDYSLAAGRLIKRFGIATWSYLWRWSPLIVAAAIGLYFLVSWILTAVPSDSRLVSLIATAAGVIGISWPAVAATLGRAVKASQAPLWKAEVKEAIVDACSRYIKEIGHTRRANDRRARGENVRPSSPSSPTSQA